jgi:hypothetical protein
MMERLMDTSMPTLDDVYRKFGEAAEAAQQLETELGTMLFAARCIDEGLLENRDGTRSASILDSINRRTLGQLLKSLNEHSKWLDTLDSLLVRARDERNRLTHSFFREHNFRRNSGEGRSLMMQDLEAIYSVVLDAYKAVMLLNESDLDALTLLVLPKKHLPI